MAAVIIILTKSVLVFKLGNFTNPEMWYRKHILVSFVWPLLNGRAVNLLSPKNAGNNESQASGSKKNIQNGDVDSCPKNATSCGLISVSSEFPCC